MRIDGKQISSEILEGLKNRVKELKEKGITPHLYVLLLTDDPSTKSYVNQKSLKSEQIGTEITVEIVDPHIPEKELLAKIEKLNLDKSIHGIIVQRPIPENLSEKAVEMAVAIDKDVDGFHPDSHFGIPVGLAVIEILKRLNPDDSENWLENKKVTVIGRGLTAGKPIIKTLRKLGIEPEVISSKTEEKEEILKNSDIVISCVGKPNIVGGSMLKKGVILLGVGMHKGEDGKFHGDFNENGIENIVSYYTPTPGGVGPVNVAKLLTNLVEAAEIL